MEMETAETFWFQMLPLLIMAIPAAIIFVMLNYMKRKRKKDEAR
jgi:hypothetical protein